MFACYNTRLMPKFVRVLGSLNFAVSLLVGLVVILSFTTIGESIKGTPFAQENFYRAHWFDFFLALVWINIFCATLTRIPFKKKHIGFVITHIGILTLLIGAFVSRQFGVEGQMTVFENEIKNKIIGEGLTLLVRTPAGKETSYDLKQHKKTKPHALPTPEGTIPIDILKVVPHALAAKQLIENPARNGHNFAVKATLSSEMMGMKETFILSMHDPDDLNPSVHTIGPALFKLEPDSPVADKKNSEQIAALILKQASSGRQTQFALPSTAQPVKWADTGLTIQNIRYTPHAKVVGKQIVNDPGSIPFNPAVEFDVLDQENRKESHTKFMLFPDFNSLKGGRYANMFDLAVFLDAPLPKDQEVDNQPSFTFMPSKDGAWKYRIRSSKSKGEVTPLQIGQKIATGWMDMTVDVQQTFQDAIIQKVILEDPDKKSGLPAVQIRAHKTQMAEDHWVLSGQPLLLGRDKQSLRLSIEPHSTLMKFSLALKDFRKIDYPGTSNPASFESDVTLSDPTRGIRIDKTISMNKPLDHDGYRIFQSSYVQDEELGEASVFTVAKNPGMMLIYPGAVLILIGVILLFYFHPFFSDRVK